MSRSTPRMMTFNLPPEQMAMRLLGNRLVRVVNGERMAGTIVEVEAYLGADDKAAHTYGGRRTPRNETMYAVGGHVYVYFTYGMHHCMNIVCGREDEGVAVLLRAIEPTEGLDHMRARRPKAKRLKDLCSGPAKLCQALAVDRSVDGLDLRQSRELWIERIRSRPIPAHLVERGPRIGIRYAEEWAEEPLRFFIRKSEHVSR